jgi:hypothetical protein
MPLVRTEVGPWLLGIDWAHISTYEKVKENDKLTDALQGYVVQSNSGQMAVVPAWKLYDLLYSDKFIIERKNFDLKLSNEFTSYQVYKHGCGDRLGREQRKSGRTQPYAIPVQF